MFPSNHVVASEWIGQILPQINANQWGQVRLIPRSLSDLIRRARCNQKTMAARCFAQRIVILFASFATLQTRFASSRCAACLLEPFLVATRRAGRLGGTLRRCEPLVVNGTTARPAPCTVPRSSPARATN